MCSKAVRRIAAIAALASPWRRHPPEQIALGAGDDYLLQLNDFFAKRGLRAYIRPLGEPNRCLNAWSPFNCDGTQKGGEHTAGWYKQAFRRIAAIVRGGVTLEQIDATLAGLDLPPLNRKKGPEPTSLPAAPVSIVWSPLAGGSPRPVWEDLNRFYRQRRWKRKPFAIAEWVVAGTDNPRFIRQLVGWTARRPRVRMFVYYRGSGEDGNPYRLGLYPRSENMLRRKIRRPSFLESAEYNAGGLPALPPVPVAKKSASTP